jgi:predicted HicB family RNase H-like nuclease
VYQGFQRFLGIFSFQPQIHLFTGCFWVVGGVLRFQGERQAKKHDFN